MPIVKNQIIPEGADLADFLASGWTTQEVIAWARKHVFTYSENGKVTDDGLAFAKPLAERDIIPVQADKSEEQVTCEQEKDSDDAIHLTDIGNAKRLVAKHGADMRYCHPWGKWLVWDGKRWLKDETGEVERRAKDTVLAIYKDVLNTDEFELREKLSKHAIKSEAANRIKSMLTVAESEPGIPILPEQLDKNSWLLNCANGTLDLRTGKLLPHQRENFITKLSPVSYDPNASCPLWESFLLKIMDNNTNLIQFLYRAVGYASTAETSEQALFILHGSGANGKSTFIETIRACLGDYAQQMPTATLMAKKGDSIPNDVARLKGARFVSATETGEGKRFSEELVKQLTGSDTVTARFMRAEYFEFTPTHKIFIGTNHKPAIRETANAIWRRIRLIPFNVTIPPEEQDKSLLNKLRAELPGILARVVKGCLEWQQNGLGMPEEVKAATEDYRKEMDILSEFLEQSCMFMPEIRVQAAVLYEAYKKWCQESGEYQHSFTRFGKQITERGIEKREADGKIWYWGIGLREANNDERTGS